MKSLARGLALIAGALALTSACGGYSVSYDGARAAKRSKNDITFYEVDCREPTLQPQDCQFNGAAMPWKPLGVFRAPKKALSNWGSYRSKVADSAALNGCPAVAFRRFPPSQGDAVGAFCVDPASVNIATPGNGGGTAPGINISVSASVQVTECNVASDCPPGLKCARGLCGN